MMRYERLTDLLKLATDMQSSSEGVALDDIEREFRVSRRTAERMRDAVVQAFPAIEELNVGDHGKKSWRFPPGTLGKMIEPTVDELSAGRRASMIARQEGDEITAAALESLLAKVQAMFTAGRRRVIATDLEAQLMADGIAFRPGPRERVDPEIVSKAR